MSKQCLTTSPTGDALSRGDATLSVAKALKIPSFSMPTALPLAAGKVA